jgi:hypothetical protein
VTTLQQDGVLGMLVQLEAQEGVGACHARRGGGVTPSCDSNLNASRGGRSDRGTNRSWRSDRSLGWSEAISSAVEIELKEEKVYAHLDEEKECDDRTWVLDIRATNHMSNC